MGVAAKRIRPKLHVSVADAKLAYYIGDFERCLALCSKVSVRSPGVACEVVLLTARAYLRLGRALDAQIVLNDPLFEHVSLDATLSAKMLLGASRIRQGDPDGGIAILLAALNWPGEAHVSIRSEIAFTLALGHWAKREIDIAEQYLARVDPRSDIIHARALELQAWCYSARGEHRRAAAAFIATLERLDRCEVQDRAITATALCSLAISAAELFDAELAKFVELRVQRIEWPAGLATQHFLIVVYLALFEEFAGNTLKAYQLVLGAAALAPSVAFEVNAWALCAAVSRNACDIQWAIAFTKRAAETLETLDFDKLAGEERLSLLALAENAAYFDIETAIDLMVRYRQLGPPDRLVASAGDPRLAGEEYFTDGVILQERGEFAAAQEHYRAAFDIFRQIGYVRRASNAAFALIKLAPSDRHALEYLTTHIGGRENYITRFLDARIVELRVPTQAQEIVAGLPRTQREVVELVCEGKSNREIAVLRSVNEQTVKNMLSEEIFRKFGVSSRAALVSMCLRTDSKQTAQA